MGIKKEEKGKYYGIILNIMGFSTFGTNNIYQGIKYLYSKHIKGIYDSIPLYFRDDHIVDKEEFVFSMTWALGDVFGGGCEIDEPEGLFDFLNH